MGNCIRRKLLLSMVLGLLVTMLMSNVAYAAGKPSISSKTFDILVGKTFELSIKNVSKDATYTWSSSNKKIATVDKKGKVKGIKKGTATITCKVKSSGKSYSLKSTANVIAPAKSISVQNKVEQLKLGDTTKLKYKLSPASSNDQVTWKTTDEAVVTVDSDGKLTAKAIGIADITAITLSGVKEEFSVAVYNDNEVRITAKDLDKDNSVAISDQIISNLYIEKSVGNAVINLDNLIITGKLTMEADSDYYVNLNSSTVAFANVIEPDSVAEVVSDAKRPTLGIGDDCEVWTSLLQASMRMEKSDKAYTEYLKIAPMIKGVYDIYLEAFKGAMEIDYSVKANVNLQMDGCSIYRASLTKAGGDNITLRNGEHASNIEELYLKAKTFLCLEVAIEELLMDQNLSEADLWLANSINQLVNNGTYISISVAQNGYIGEIVSNKGSQGNWGNYDFLDTDSADFSFNLSLGDKLIEGIRMDDILPIIDNINSMWTDKSKPFVADKEKNETVEFIDENTYRFDFDGLAFTISIHADQGAVTIVGDENVKIIEVGVAKDKDKK